jgi:hypothetical protein
MARYHGVLAASLLVASLGTAQDLTLDAVTRATTLNPSTGAVAVLHDGRTPDLDPTAPAFTWESTGLFAVSWDHPVQVAALRVYLGEMQRYAVYGYLGGRFTDTGQRVDVETPVFSREGLVPIDAAGWYEIALPGDRAVDNLGIQVIGSAILYEIQLVGPAGTAVELSSLGLIKKDFAR